MRQIKKGKPPKSFVEYCAKNGANYVGFQTATRMKALRDSLIAEQGGICCYCMQRIRALEGSIKIEHWRSQARFPDDQLLYSNLLGACMGNEGQPPHLQHCDTRKGSQSLCKNPADSAHRIEDYIRYLGDGTISSNDKQLNRQLSSVLNLNYSVLVLNRKAVFDSFHKSLPSGRDLKKAELRRMEKDWGSGSSGVDLRPFCGIVVYWVRKRLARCAR
jgi:uncharacterized protein (TIGR02646 family)